MTVRLEGRGLTKSFGRRPAVRAVTDVSLEVRAGETLGLVGESGAGKSTVGRMLAGLATPDEGIVRWDGVDVRTLRGPAALAARRSVQVVFQDPVASLNPRFTVRDTLGEAVSLRRAGDRVRTSAADVAGEVEGLLDRVGLSVALCDRRPAALSGGQAQRVVFARALALRPRAIILDEPFSALDAVATARLSDLLLDLQEADGLAYLMITHDLGLIGHLADRIAVMREGRLVEAAVAPSLIAQPQDPYTRELLASVPGQG